MMLFHTVRELQGRHRWVHSAQCVFCKNKRVLIYWARLTSYSREGLLPEKKKKKKLNCISSVQA
jgi:hypothetical protein